MIEKYKNYHVKYIITLVFASIFLASFGMISHNAFADTVTTTIPAGSYPQSVAVNPITNKIYVADGESQSTVIDGATNTVVANLPVSQLNTIDVNPNTNMIYGTIGPQFYAINGSTNQVVSTFQLTGSNTGDLKVNPVTNKIYITETGYANNHPVGYVSIINGTTNTLEKTIMVNGASGLAINPVTNKVYLSYGTISVIDGATDTIVGSISGATTAGAMAINPDTNRLYATSNSYGTMAIADLTTNSVISTIPVGAGAGLVTVNPDTNKIYVDLPNYPNGTGVTVVNGSTNTILQNLTVGKVPIGIAANPNTNKIYVSNGLSNTVSVIDGSSSNASNTSTTPSAPQNLQATAGNAQISLSWSASQNNGGSAITNYKIYRSTSSGNETLLATTGNVTSYNDTATSSGQTYYYKVTAVNSIGESPQSNEASAMPFASAGPVVATIPVNGAYGVATNPNTNLTYVATGQGYQIQVINDTTNTVIDTIQTQPPQPTSCFGSTEFVAVNPNTNMIYTSNGGCTIQSNNTPTHVPQTISIINGTNNNVIAVLTPSSNDIYESAPIVVNPITNKVYALDTQYGVYVIDGNTNSGKLVMVQGQVESWLDLAIDTKTNMIYVDGLAATGGGPSPIGVVNGTTDSYVTTFDSNGDSEIGIAVVPSTNQIYISNSYLCSSSNSCNSNAGPYVSVFDGSTYQMKSSIAAPHGYIGINQLTNKIYVGNQDSDTISVIDGQTNTIINTVQVGNGPFGIGINTVSNKIYVANSGSSTVSVIDSSSSSGTSNTSVPSAPQNLAATAGNAQVSLSWTAPSSNGDSPITNYNVYRGTASGNETLLTKIGNLTSYNDTTITNGQEYFYKVTAVNSVGESPQSNEASATPSAPATVPSAPTGLTTTTVSSSQINLSWTVPANNGGSAITGYMIERSNNTGTTWSTVQSNTGSTSTTYNDTGLAASTTYTYRVSAINSAGTSSPSNTASATTSAAAAPAGITLNNIQKTSGTVSSSPYQMTLANFNAGTGSNNLLVVGISANNAGVTSVTFGGVHLSKKVSSFSNNDAEFWYLKNPSGTGNIVVTMSGSTSAVVGAYSFSGVDQTTPIPTSITKHNTSSSSPKISITTQYSNSWVLDLPAIYGGVTLGSPTCTQQWDANIAGAITGASSSALVQSPGSATCSWTASSGELWDDVAVEIKASATGSSSTTTVPSSPTGLAATAGNSQVSLSWTVPSNNGGSAIYGYNIYRGTTSGGEGTTPVGTVSGSTLTYNDTGLTNGQTYFYKVTAVNSVGQSAPSNEASATPAAAATAPQPPTGLAANAASSSQINLSWTAPASNGGSAITGYMIERSNNTGTAWSTVQSNTGSTATTYNDTGLAASTAYTYRVSAINSAGTSSPSNTASATTSVTAPPPTGITLDNIQKTSGTVSSSPYQLTLSNFNAGTGSNNLLVVGISANNNVVASVTFGGVQLTREVSSFNNNDAEFWYLKNPSGTGNIVVTMGGSTSVVVGAYSFSGVDQTAPIPTSATNHNTAAGSPIISITTQYPNSLILDLPAIYGGVTLGSPTCMQEWNINIPGAITGASSSAVKTSAGSATCSWTASNGGDLWDDVAVEIKALG